MSTRYAVVPQTYGHQDSIFLTEDPEVFVGETLVDALNACPFGTAWQTIVYQFKIDEDAWMNYEVIGDFAFKFLDTAGTLRSIVWNK